MTTLFVEPTCSNCGARNHPGETFTLKTTILFANQHQTRIRRFCDACGQWEDITLRRIDGEIVKRRIVRMPIGEGS